MNPKLLRLINVLLESSDWMTANQLSNRLSVSVRTIKNYINEINTYRINTIISSNNGYRIDSEKAKSFNQLEDQKILQGSDERINYLISKILRSPVAINIYDVSDELYVSSSTIKSDFNKLRQKLENFNLTLVNSQDFLSINGLEKNKRKVLSHLLYEESNESIVVLESIQNAFPTINIPFIKESIDTVFNEDKIYINDFAMITLIMHIVIAIHRMQHHAENIDEDSMIDLKITEIYDVAKKLVKKIEPIVGVKFTNGEIDNLAILIYSSTTNLDYRSISENNLQDLIGKDTVDLVYNLIQDLGTYYMIDFNDPDFIARFSLHIKNLLFRSKNNQYSKNPMTETIRRSCPLLYDTSVVLASKLNDLTGAFINEDEIAFIAFHLGGALESHKSNEDQLRCILYCPTYYDTSTKLKDNINRHFREQINLISIITEEAALNQVKNIDLVLTTIPLNQTNYTQNIQNISLFLNQKDLESITQKISFIKREKKKIQFYRHLKKMFNPQLFRHNIDFTSEFEAIDFMVNALVKLEYVQPHFKEEVIERENMSSTSFNNLAIPHSMKMSADKTGLFVIINDKPTPWGHNKVNLIMMLTINRLDRALFNEVYENLTMILTEAEAMNKVLQAKNYDDFINTLVEYL